MTQTTDRGFSALVEDGWTNGSESPPFTIVSDATSPKTPSNVMRTTYPPGSSPGESPSNVHTQKTITAFAKVYICLAAKLSSNWVGNGSQVNKYGFLWTAPELHPSFFFGAHGSDSDPLQPYAFTQNLINLGGGFFFDPNLVPSAEIVRGQWHVYEYFVQGNTAGTGNGTVDWYLDGVHVGSATGIQWTTGATAFDVISYYPIWGGGNPSPAITVTQTMDWDHIYVSGKA